MWEYLTPAVARAIAWSAVAMVVSIGGWHFVSAWRDRNSGVDTDVDVLANFHEMRQRGVLDDDEFRTIKANLGVRTNRKKTSQE